MLQSCVYNQTVACFPERHFPSLVIVIQLFLTLPSSYRYLINFHNFFPFLTQFVVGFCFPPSSFIQLQFGSLKCCLYITELVETFQFGTARLAGGTHFLLQLFYIIIAVQEKLSSTFSRFRFVRCLEQAFIEFIFYPANISTLSNILLTNVMSW